MNETQTMTIGEVCATISDTYRAKADEVTLINTSDVLEGKVLNHERVPNKELKGQFKKTFKKNDILYSEIRPQNKRFAFVDFDPVDYIASTKLMVLRADTSKVLPMYLYYYLKSAPVIAELQMLAETRSGTFPQITFTELSNLTIPVPSISEQEAIVATIKCMEDRIDCNTKINDNLEQQAQALFSNYNATHDSPEVPLVYVATIKYGKGLPKSKLQTEGYPVYGGNGIIGCYNTFMYKDPQILISCRGAASGNIIISNPKSFVTSNSLVVELQDYRYFEFLKQHLQANPLFAYATGSAQPQITIDNLRNVSVPYPNYCEIADITEQLSVISDMVLSLNSENKILAELRDSLLPRLMSGNLDVSDLT